MFYLWPEKIWQDHPSNISNYYYFNTVLHQGTSQGRQTTDKHKVLLSTSSKATSSVRWTVSHSLQWCVFTPVNRQKQMPSLIHNTKTGFTLCHSPVYNTNGKLYNSCIKQQQTVQHNFHTNMQLHVPKMFYNFLTLQTWVGPWRTFIKESKHSSRDIRRV
jgi:hypothetical protein